ncbi:MAG TPA: hypothetical protein VF846_14430 [Thermoanaerobaculia bacterium]|jgi:photosystem II stability/assembly factor-like uncharacterized protein
MRNVAALLTATSIFLACTSTAPRADAPQNATAAAREAQPEPQAQRAVAPDTPLPWKQLTTEAYRGKQDDIFFIDEKTGWYVNGAGRIYKSTDGGETWVLKLNKPGTYFRCIAFVDEKRGFAGNIGTEYFPNVTDETPLYETRDGGETWTAVTSITGPAVKGLCAIWVNRFSYINAGNLDYKTHIYAAGRVGGPAFLMKSTDGGDTWTTTDLSEYTAIITDVMMFDEFNGVICGSSDRNTQTSNARIITTSDGGKTWTTRYQSARPYEITWKVSFPTRKTGYVTVQNYNPDKTVSQRYVAKSTDGGMTWSELPVTDDHAFREFGIGFIDENTGWIGGSTTGFETRDGGATWRAVNLGKATNKIRLMETDHGFVGYAIGVDVYKLDAE